jgi:hypothetical protein
MANPRPLKLSNAALLKPEKRFFGAKSIRSIEKIQILALKMAIFQKCGPRADFCWPWLHNTNWDIFSCVDIATKFKSMPKI